MKNYLQYKNWYQLTSNKLKRKYKKDFPLICGLIASISPQFRIKRNINTADRIYTDFKKYGNDFIKDLEYNRIYNLIKYKILNSHYYNILRCLKHDFKNDLKLSGDKVNAFYHNLLGDLDNYVTIDTWMSRYFNHQKSWINKGDYIRYSKIIIKLAKKENLRPAEMQSIIWIKIRCDNGFKPINFTKFI